MKPLLCMASASLAVSLAVVPAAAQQVSYDVDRTKNFSSVSTFAVDTGTKSDNPLVDQRVIAGITSALTARGLTQVDHDADVLIVPRRTSEMRQEVTVWNTGWPYYGGGYWGGYGSPYWYGGWGATSYDVRDRRYDTITIDMVDAKTGALMWRGQGVKHVHSNWDAEDIDKKVYKTVAKIMGKLPAVGTSGVYATTTDQEY